MNGWQRIGIVLSAVWTAIVLVYAAYEYYRFPLQPLTVHLSRPDYADYENAKSFRFIEIRETPGKEAISGEESALYEKVIREAATESERQSYIAARDLVHYSSGVSWVFLLLAISLPIVLAWVLVAVGVHAFLWVRNGFSAGP